MDFTYRQSVGNRAGAAPLSRSDRSALPARRFSKFRIAVLTGTLLMTACAHAPPSTSPRAGDEWHDFEGTWSAVGNRNGMLLGDDRRASIANLEGTLLLAGPNRPAVGFRAEAIVLNDTVTGMIGRAVWTDEKGDQAYSELRGEGTATNNKIFGTFVGGTGRYAGATGTYEFSWRFVLEAEDGSIQGQSLGLKGRVRVDSTRRASDVRGPR